VIGVALALQAYGLTVHPLKPRDKAPAVSGWQQLRMTEQDVVTYWGQHPDANVGLICGATGWVALDLDGDRWLEWALAHFPPTPLRTISGSGKGGHLIYRWPVGEPVAKRRLHAPGLADSRVDKSLSHEGGDLYGDGSQVVLPGSVHPSGGLYRWAFDGPLPPLEAVPYFDLAWLPAAPAPLPAPAAPALRPRAAGAPAGDADRLYRRAEAWMAKRDPAVQGQRGDDHTFVTCANLVRDFGLGESEAWDLLQPWNATCQPPWPPGELRAKLASAMRTATGTAKAERPLEDTGQAWRAELEQGLDEWRNEAQASGIGLADPFDGLAPFHDDDQPAAAAAQPMGTAATRKRKQSSKAGVPVPGAAAPGAAPPGAAAPGAARAGRIAWPVRQRGKPAKDHLDNTRALLEHYGVAVRYNLMTHALEVEIPGFKVSAERAGNTTLDWVENRAADHGLARAPVYKHLNELAVEYHPVLQWVESRAWDGVDRLPDLLATLQLQQQADVELSGLLVQRWLLGCAAAILPDFTGQFTAQGVLVAQGEQGRNKTRWLRSLAPPGSGWVLTGRTLDPRDRDSVQAATSVWLCELGEVDATFRKADIAALKAFVTQDADTYRSAYARREERVTRRTVFFASVNDPQYLVDKTGNRRWWTVPIERCNADHQVDVQQLWAQVVELVRQPGARWWLTEDEQLRLAEVNVEHEPDDALAAEVRDTWQPSIFDVASDRQRGVSLAEVCRGLPSFENKTPSPAETHRIVNALRELGARTRRFNNGRTYYVERRNDVPQAPRAARKGWGGDEW
jgi:hypothetical protein